MISQLLSDLGERHPQALVFPLSVAAKSESQSRANAANRVLETMRVHGEGLVEAALLVSKELIRVAIPWCDLWHESLQQAWSVYSVNNQEGLEPMLQLLQSLHAELRRGAETPAEVAFLQAYGRELREAEEWCTLYQTSRNHGDLSQAWDLYCRVFLSLKTQLPQITTLHLSAASPKLLGVRDVELAVPGTYGQGSSVVTIQSFLPKLNIIKSKQRPRRVSILGSDGKEYPFLLKGHEDLRQDERVMQLFSLINTLLANDRETASRHLSIKRYAIIPLSPHSGLIEWVPNHDTLNTLIVDYRKAKNIPTDAEYHALLLMASNWKAGMKLAALNADYFKLALMQKVEVFENALSKTEGKDLNQVLWLKSPNAEMWLERRTNFTRSLAVMSMVGYVLGLGDRHPSNIMLDRHTGKITHIDFGDCFEVAMTRDKLPEKVPFRLTRMLVNAMEVSGIEGNFRFTCESVMRVLREHKESVMAVLEAFVYDPLINWRLLHPEKNAEEVARPPDGTRGRNASLAAVVAEDEVGDLPVRASYLSLVAPEKVAQQNEEGLNKRALDVVNRISAKLKGKDFGTAKPLDVAQQVQRLVFEATSVENLCQAYEGWRAFW
ncbi:phosphatidylinositol kinase- protein kinase tor1 [Balamuthia mandrillaris]